MSNDGNEDRRKILKGSLTVAAAYASSGILSVAAGASADEARVVRLQDVVDVAAATSIGRVAAHSVPENTPAALTRAVQETVLVGARRFDVKSVADFKKHLAERIRDDFAHERTVTVDGWLVSLTEARIFALVARAGGGHVLWAVA